MRFCNSLKKICVFLLCRVQFGSFLNKNVTVFTELSTGNDEKNDWHHAIYSVFLYF